jgi:branched-chain amino acid transport system substrate-binding protein
VRLRSLLTVGLAVCIAATSAAACKSSGGGSGGSTSAAAQPSGGGGSQAASGKTLVIGTDLPLQGSNKDTSDSTNNLIQLYLDSVGDKAGPYNIKLKIYDDSTAAAGSWDAATCTQNANAHVSNTDEVAVMGTYNSGCAKLEVPILNQANPPMLMVSDANTSPGLTKAYSGNDPGEPDKYYPTGKRNYARVVSTDDFQGPADANFAKTLNVKRCFVVNDNSTYGKGVAGAFVKGAEADGIKILGNQAYDSKQPSYASLFTKVKSQNPDCVFIGGTYDLNGGQLIKDKFNVLGDNTKVKLIAPDGYTGFPDLDKQPESQGMYLSFAGLDTGQILAKGGAPAKLLDAYKAKYGSMPIGSYPIYGVAAIQVILAAIAKSDGTRQSIIDQVFSGSGITIPASESAIGKEFSISTSTGDVSAKDYSILQEKNHTAVFLKNVAA